MVARLAITVDPGSRSDQDWVPQEEHANEADSEYAIPLVLFMDEGIWQAGRASLWSQERRLRVDNTCTFHYGAIVQLGEEAGGRLEESANR